MDKNYWETFYLKQNAELKPSLFARYVADLLLAPKEIVELGCGNGRDALFFANLGHSVTAIDQCESEIKFLSTRYQQLKNIYFMHADFTKMDNRRPFDLLYSRFTLHSISAQQEKDVCIWAFNNLNVNGYFCIEARGQKNEIFRKGQPVQNEPDAFIYDQHYRRFLNFDAFCHELKQIGFKIHYAAEEKGFAPFNGENETYIRVVAQRK
ncbi:MAG TPA: class I SAM-dependent methyltransferase [Bacteroidales bacterium]|jgi:tellurite methyltransferase|nr:class I SAM-dependent methyltransferase [Bacteroidales bacterium]